MAGLTRRENGVYYVIFYHEGRKHRRSLMTSKLSEAKRLVREIEQQLRSGAHKANSSTPGITLAELWVKYEAWAVKQLSPQTVNLRRRYWREIEALAPTAAECTPQLLGDFLDSKEVAGNGRTVNGIKKHMSAVWSTCMRKGWIAGSNPWAQVERRREEPKEFVILTTEQIEALLEAAEVQGQDMHLFVALGVLAGLRYAEIDAARWSWIRWPEREGEQGTLTVTAGHGFRPKSGRNRTIPINSRLLAVLERYRQPSGYMVRPSAPVPTTSGNRYRWNAEKHAFPRVAQAAGLGDLNLSPKRLRESFTSRLVQSGVSIYKASKWLGHASVETTAQHYAKIGEMDTDIEKIF